MDEVRTESADTARISVVIPAYNATAYLPATLASVFNQSARPGEVIVVDDGSTDGTPALARSLGATVISLTNGGPSAARNAGTRAANGEYIAYLDADDVWLPEKLEVQFATLQSCGRPAFSFTDYRLLDERGVHRCKSELRRHWAFRKIAGNTSGRAEILIEAREKGPVLYDSYILPSSVLVRRTDALAVGGFDETLRMTEDYEFFLRLLRIVPAVAILQPLLLYRRHVGQATAKGTLAQSGFFAVAQRVAAAPGRYPPGDVRYIASREYLREYQMGMRQSRVGQFDEAVASFERSLAARTTARARLALAGSHACRSAAGRRTFQMAQWLWHRRPGKR